MDSKLLLVKIITLLFAESCNPKPTGHARSIAKLALEEIKPTNQGLVADFSRDTIGKLFEIVNWMLTRPIDERFSATDILSRTKLAVESEEYIYDALATEIDGEKTDEDIKNIIKNSREHINQFLRQSSITKIMRDGYRAVQFNAASVDWNNFVKDISSQLEPYLTNGPMDSSTLVEYVDIGNSDSLVQAFKLAKEQVSSEGVIRFGWRGLNRMFGDQGGGRRGEFLVIGALQHNFKSGTALEMAKSAALYNKPYMIDPTKKPLILRISLENPLANDIIHIYRSLIEPEINAPVDQASIDPLQAAAYTYERLTENGYHFQIEHHDPSDYTIHKLIETIEKYEEQGYEIHLLSIDYLAMMSTKGCKQGATGQDIRDLFRRARNATETRHIFTVTPHQLSVEAKKLTRGGVDDFVKEIANKGYYDSCSTIDQEVDMEIYQHKVVVNGVSYLTMQRGKHRKSGLITPPTDLYCVYQFNATRGFIDDDILTYDQSMNRIAAAPRSAGGEPAWFDMG